VPGDRGLEELAVTWLFSGAAIGLYLGGFDHVARTGEYLLHRSLRRSTIVLTRLATGLILGVLIVTLPLLLSALGVSATWEHNVVEPYRRLPQHLGLGLVFWSGFTGTFYGITLRGSLLTRLVWVSLAFLAGIAALVAGITPWGPRALQASLGFHVGLQLLLTTVFACGAWAEFVAGDDLDRALPTRFLVPSALALTLVATLTGPIALTSLQSVAQQQILFLSPEIWERGEGGGFTLARDVAFNAVARPVPVDEHHTATGEKAEVLDRRLSSPRWIAPSSDWRWQRFSTTRIVFFDGTWENWADAFVSSLFFRPVEGRVYLANEVRHKGRKNGFQWTRVRRGDDDETFSRDCLVLGPPTFRGRRHGQGWSSKSLIADLEDGTIWFAKNYASDPSYARVDLPDGDRPVSGALNARNELLVLGERGTYRWNGGGFDSTPDDRKAFAETPTQARARSGLEPTVVEADPLSPLVEVRDRDGAKFQHRYGLYTLGERLLGSVIFGATLTRPPPFNVWSFVSQRRANAIRFDEDSIGRRTDPGSVLLDPVLAAGKRPWLLGLSVALSLGLGGLAARRLRRLGGSNGRARFWLALTMLGGPLVYVLYRVTETRRAWRPATILTPEKQEPLLIRSA